MVFEKQLIKKNEGAINSEVLQMNSTKSYLQEYVNRVVALGVEIEENDLDLLFRNPKAFFTDKFTKGESMKVGGLKLNKEKLFDLIEKPAGTNTLIESISRDNQDRGIRESHIWSIKNYAIDNNNTVIVKVSVLDHIHKKHSLFIENENQKAGFEKLQQITQLVNEINQLQGQSIGFNTELSDLMILSNNVFETKAEAVKMFR